ncbi:hypothetical protein KXD40_001307 [Peronospora effusa]|uniref:Uncharacterized protein n=1 Tax=Peronospora effusa TaxID=542832 RepID=A0A3M6VMF5_9STRA|nr:hypothetical protein DD238_000323 [Peronospora effusa]UIZ21670.1 hypothetical protein KXD40_001307 [Peronospora effusa]
METDCTLRLCIAQLHSSAVSFDTETQSYVVAHAKMSRVQVVGVLIKRLDMQLKLDDGTGILDAEIASSVCRQELQLGALVECVGAIEEPWPPSKMTCTRRWLNATQQVYYFKSLSNDDENTHVISSLCSVHEIQDCNVETLRMFEVIHLYNTDYAVPSSSPPADLELLAFPPMDSTTTLMSEPGSKVTRQCSNGLQPKEFEASSTLIEKPWEQQRVGAPHQDVDIPPADYQFALPERDHALVEQGTKSLEIRLNVAPYSIIHVNDRITINGKTLTIVVAVRKYSRLQSVVETEDMNALLPQTSFLGAETFNAAAAAERHYRQFFSAEEEEHYGLVVFQLALPRSSSSAPISQEEWSTLVLRQLEAKNGIGCSVADLRFAFPVLPVDQIMDILANLQFDALVIHVNGKYRRV